MRSILGLFAENPFEYLNQMALKVEECAHGLTPLFDAFFSDNQKEVRIYAEHVSDLEHQADELKNSTRDRLPRRIFLPVDRRDLLEVIGALDAVADNAEDVAILFTLRDMPRYDAMTDLLKQLLREVLLTVDQTAAIIAHLSVLVDVGFKGPQVKNMFDMIEEVNRLEHEADITQDALARILFNDLGDTIKPVDLFLWNKIVKELGDVANAAERVGGRVRLFLAS